jgi:hypothetical protein
MKTLKQVDIEPVFVEEYMPDVFEPGKLYISKKFDVAIHICLCGTCGLQVVTPLGDGEWNILEHESGKVSLSPSIGNYQYPCKSHYIITKNKANFV